MGYSLILFQIHFHNVHAFSLYSHLTRGGIDIIIASGLPPVILFSKAYCFLPSAKKPKLCLELWFFGWYSANLRSIISPPSPVAKSFHNPALSPVNSITVLLPLLPAYMALGNPQKAKELLERALVIQEKHYGLFLI